MDFLRSLRHPEEIYNLLRFNLGGCRAVMSELDRDSMSESLQTCYRYLDETSRSFAAVVQTLDGELRHVFGIFYLVLRALDTVEDDMTINLETKIPMLRNFHTYLYDPEWKFTESKDKDRQVLEDFPTISLEFRNLAVDYQDVIADVCAKVGAGLAEFQEKKMDSWKEWEKYCHYAGGMWGIGASRLFSASQLEDADIGLDTQFSNSMGKFLQKTNTIRDYLKDQLEGREFWPKEVWSKYGEKLSDLAMPEIIVPAVQCLNELITKALSHVPDVLTYLSRIKNQRFFHFSAIPQVMAMATLAACYNNPQVFKGVVKIRKAQTVTIMMDATNMEAVKALMLQYIDEIYHKIPPTDPTSGKTQHVISSVRSLCLPNSSAVPRNRLSPIYLPCAMLLAALGYQYLRMVSQGS